MRAPLALCERRDPKGLYKRARAGQLKGFTGAPCAALAAACVAGSWRRARAGGLFLSLLCPACRQLSRTAAPAAAVLPSFAVARTHAHNTQHIQHIQHNKTLT